MAPPVLTALPVSNGLSLQWTNNAALVDSSDNDLIAGYLTIIDNTASKIDTKYIKLKHMKKGFLELENLINGNLYTLVLTQYLSDTQGFENVVNSSPIDIMPSSVPDSPVVTSVEVNSVQTGAKVSVKLGSDNGEDIDLVVVSWKAKPKTGEASNKPINKVIYKRDGYIINNAATAFPVGSVLTSLESFKSNALLSRIAISGLEAERSYILWVEAFNASGASKTSKLFDFSTSRTAKVVDVASVMSGKDGELQVTLVAPVTLTTETSVTIQVSTDGRIWSDAVTILKQPGQTGVTAAQLSTGKTLTGLNNGSIYYVAAYTSNAYGSSDLGVAKTGIPCFLPMPGKVTLSGVLGNATTGSLTATLSDFNVTATSLPLTYTAVFAKIDVAGSIVALSTIIKEIPAGAFDSSVVIKYSGVTSLAETYKVEVTAKLSVSAGLQAFWTTSTPALSSGEYLFGSLAVSSETFGIPQKPTAMSAPTLRSFSHTNSLGEVSYGLEANWVKATANSSPVLSYIIRWYDSISSVTSVNRFNLPIHEQEVAATEFNVVYNGPSLNASRSYYASVAATSAVGSSVETLSSAVTLQVVPNAPLNVRAEQTGDAKITLYWDLDETPIFGYANATDTWAIQQQDSTVSFGAVTSVSRQANKTSYSQDMAGLTAPGKYVFTIKTMSTPKPNLGLGSESEQVEVSASIVQKPEIQALDAAKFTKDAAGDDILSFQITDKGSELVGVTLFVAPLILTGEEKVVFNLTKSDATSYDHVTGVAKFKVRLGYNASSVGVPVPPHLIVASNGYGTSYIQNLSANV